MQGEQSEQCLFIENMLHMWVVGGLINLKDLDPISLSSLPRAVYGKCLAFWIQPYGKTLKI